MLLGVIILIVFGAFFLIAIIQNAKNPPRMVEVGDLSKVVRSEMNHFFPKFEYESIRFAPLKREYNIHGRYLGDEVKVEVELSKSEEITELEFEVKGYYGKRFGAEFKDVGEVPKPILEVAFAVLGIDGDVPQFVRGNHIKLLDEAGYSFKFKSGKEGYDFQILESGKLIEFEVKRYR